MQISVRGARDRTLVQLLKLAANFFGEQMLSPQLLKNIHLNIVIRDKLDAGGFCDYEDDGGPPREFNIEILRTRKKINMFKVLAHEMVHLKQIAKGEMKDKYIKSKYVTLWFGEKYHEDEVSYWDQPWEIEAYGLENSLVAKFLIEHDQFKNLRQKHGDWFAAEALKEK